MYVVISSEESLISNPYGLLEICLLETVILKTAWGLPGPPPPGVCGVGGIGVGIRGKTQVSRLEITVFEVKPSSQLVVVSVSSARVTGSIIYNLSKSSIFDIVFPLIEKRLKGN